jgi:hypothetical protein
VASRYFPEEVVRFIAKTGFISKDLWGEFFFVGGQPRWRRQVWADLLNRKYLVPHPFGRISNVYVLNRHNKEIIDFVCGKAAKSPPAAQLDHDEILSRGLLRLERARGLVQWMSEAELKSTSGEVVHRIETQGQLIKFPDALVYTGRTAKALPIAIELEKTLKSRSRYEQIVAAYASMGGLRAILYICDSAVTERAIGQALERAYFPEALPVGFAGMDAWRADPLTMDIRVGRNRMQWADFSALPLESRSGWAVA